VLELLPGVLPLRVPVLPEPVAELLLPPGLTFVRMNRSAPLDADELPDVDPPVVDPPVVDPAAVPDVPVAPVAAAPARCTHPTTVIVCELLL